MGKTYGKNYMKKALLTREKPWFEAARKAKVQGHSDVLTEGLTEAAEKQCLSKTGSPGNGQQKEASGCNLKLLDSS